MHMNEMPIQRGTHETRKSLVRVLCETRPRTNRRTTSSVKFRTASPCWYEYYTTVRPNMRPATGKEGSRLPAWLIRSCDTYSLSRMERMKMRNQEFHTSDTSSPTHASWPSFDTVPVDVPEMGVVGIPMTGGRQIQEPESLRRSRAELRELWDRWTDVARLWDEETDETDDPVEGVARIHG